VRGYRYPAGGRTVRAKPVIAPTGPERSLSFVNLMEALTLAGFRQMRVPMQRVRKALDYAARFVDAEHLLASERLLTDGTELFWEFHQELAKDYGLTFAKIEAAVRLEVRLLEPERLAA